MSPRPLPELVDQLKALANPIRLRILAILRDGELCVCEITELVALAPSTVSQHLSDLRKAGFIAERKTGRWVHYALVPDAFPLALLGVLWLQLSEDPTVASDQRAALEARAQVNRACVVGQEFNHPLASVACERA